MLPTKKLKKKKIPRTVSQATTSLTVRTSCVYAVMLTVTLSTQWQIFQVRHPRCADRITKYR